MLIKKGDIEYYEDFDKEELAPEISKEEAKEKKRVKKLQKEAEASMQGKWDVIEPNAKLARSGIEWRKL